jgi:FkbM family methyltransferase
MDLDRQQLGQGKVRPDEGEPGRLFGEAFAHFTAGRFAEALRLINRALVTNPDAPDLLYAHASILFGWGRSLEALTSYKRSEAAGLEHAELYVYLGRSYSMTGRAAEAESCMRKAVALEPDSWLAHFGLAAVLHAQKRLELAISEYERTIELRPDAFDCHTGLGNCAIDLNDPVVAEAHFRRATALDEKRSDGWADLGVALERQQRFAEAMEAYKKAERLDPKTPGGKLDSFYNIAIGLAEAGRAEESLSVCEANLAERPSVPGYHAYSLALLAAGRLLEGWNLHDFRWLKEPYLSLRPKFPCPQWDGQDLRGKTILLLNEQGLGDTIQFLRYARYVKAAGATVVLRVSPGLQELASGFAGIDQVVGLDGGHFTFDTYIHLMSLAHVFGTELSSIPAEVPYLNLDPATVERWATRISGGTALKVGLVWAGSPVHLRDRYRSLSLKALAPILSVDGVRFFCLQKGPAAAEVGTMPAGVDFVNLDPDLKDFRDTAAVISHLDLLISVDTSVAHLAGALGKPVWLMLPRPADWRWLLEREDSPWYPTMRLFRQVRRGEWSEIISRIATVLAERVRSGPADTVPHKVSVAFAQGPPVPLLPRLRPGHRPGFSAVAECRHGIVQYLPDEELIGDSLGWYGEYLKPQLDLLLRLTRPGSTVLEAGAGIGAHALPLAQALGDEGHLILYESRPIVRRILQQNLTANKVRNVTIMRKVLGAGAGRDKTASTRLPSAAVEIPETGGFETVDDLQLEKLHLLKINEAAHALAVIEGAAETLWRVRPLLFISTRSEVEFGTAVAKSRDCGYRCWKMQTAQFDPNNFNRRDGDIFSGREALALLGVPEEVKIDLAFEGCVEL